MKTLGLTKQIGLAMAAALMLSACGGNPVQVGSPGSSPYLNNTYGQNTYDSAYGQSSYSQTGYDTSGYAQNGYGQTGYAQNGYGAYNQTASQTPYGPNQGYPPNGQYPASQQGGFAFQQANPAGYAGAYLPGAPGQPQPSPTPKASAAPADKAPDPISPTQFNQVSEDLAVLTYNVWGLPGLLGTRRKERFSRLGAALNAFDVVTLQEAYSDDIETLRQSSGFIHHARINNSSLLKTGSGLYTLSKYPILKTEYQEFAHCSGADCLTRKGILLTRVDHPKIGPVDIYSVSYQSGDSAKAKAIRSDEDNRQLQEMIQRNHSDYPVVITGDFGFVPEQTEYQDLNSRLSLIDSFSKLHPDEGGYTVTPDNPNMAGEGVPMRLDYVFLLKKPGIEITPLEVKLALTEPVDGYVLSDHYGVSARLRVRISK